MRSCDSRKKHALSMRLRRPRLHPREVIRNQDGQRTPPHEVCFPFDAMLQSKAWERDAKHLVTLQRATHTTKRPSNIHIGRLDDRNTIVHGSEMQLSKSPPLAPPKRCWFLILAAILGTYQLLSFPSTSEGDAAIPPPTTNLPLHAVWIQP